MISSEETHRSNIVDARHLLKMPRSSTDPSTAPLLPPLLLACCSCCCLRVTVLLLRAAAALLGCCCCCCCCCRDQHTTGSCAAAHPPPSSSSSHASGCSSIVVSVSDESYLRKLRLPTGVNFSLINPFPVLCLFKKVASLFSSFAVF